MTSQTASPVQAGATLTYEGKSVSLPVLRGTENETAIDIEKLRAQTGLITMDPGYGNTGSCRSASSWSQRATRQSVVVQVPPALPPTPAAPARDALHA